MSNIIDYVSWRGDLDFTASPFNEVDSLILTQLVYLDFRGIVPGIHSRSSVTLEKAAEEYFAGHSNQAEESGGQLLKDCRMVLKAVMGTERFKNCRLSRYIEDISEEKEYQFSAVKIVSEDGSIYISFSGTDSSLAGWKENFNMSYLARTPGQERAVQYVQKVLETGRKPVRLGGHSKGGNLAVYAAIKGGKHIQNRLRAVYNFDGPGFNEDMVKQEEYQNILPKLHTLIPQSSVIGMLLEHEEDYTVVESTEKGLLQHRALSWKVMGSHFVYSKGLSQSSIFWNETLKQWIAGMEKQEKKEFVDALFEVIETAGIKDTDQLYKLTPVRLMGLMKAIDELPEKKRETLSETIRKLADEVGKAKKNGRNKT